MCLSFSSSVALMKRCVTDLFAASSAPSSAPSPPPKKIFTAPVGASSASFSFAAPPVGTGSAPPIGTGAKNLAAILRTALGHVAVKRRVCRPSPSVRDASSTRVGGGAASNTSRSWGSKPMSSMRSASSRTTWWHRSSARDRWVMRSHSRPGVATTANPETDFCRLADRSASFWSPMGAPP